MSEVDEGIIKSLPKLPELAEGLPLERVKALVDFTKHVATLSTATLLLTATFADRIFANMPTRGLLLFPLVLAAASLFTCLFAQLGAINLLNRPLVAKIDLQSFMHWLMFATCSFLFAVFCLVGLVIYNFPS